jgi:hypothetical protein
MKKTDTNPITLQKTINYLSLLGFIFSFIGGVVLFTYFQFIHKINLPLNYIGLLLRISIIFIIFCSIFSIFTVIPSLPLYFVNRTKKYSELICYYDLSEKKTNPLTPKNILLGLHRLIVPFSPSLLTIILYFHSSLLPKQIFFILCLMGLFSAKLIFNEINYKVKKKINSYFILTGVLILQNFYILLACSNYIIFLNRSTFINNQTIQSLILCIVFSMINSLYIFSFKKDSHKTYLKTVLEASLYLIVTIGCISPLSLIRFIEIPLEVYNYKSKIPIELRIKKEFMHNDFIPQQYWSKKHPSNHYFSLKPSDVLYDDKVNSIYVKFSSDDSAYLINQKYLFDRSDIFNKNIKKQVILSSPDINLTSPTASAFELKLSTL